jgi:hypothetical protein
LQCINLNAQSQHHFFQGWLETCPLEPSSEALCTSVFFRRIAASLHWSK